MNMHWVINILTSSKTKNYVGYGDRIFIDVKE